MAFRIGDYLKKQRVKSRVSVRELAKATGLKDNRIRTIEGGGKPSLSELEAMGNICGYTIEQLRAMSEEVETICKLEEKIMNRAVTAREVFLENGTSVMIHEDMVFGKAMSDTANNKFLESQLLSVIEQTNSNIVGVKEVY